MVFFALLLFSFTDFGGSIENMANVWRAAHSQGHVTERISTCAAHNVCLASECSQVTFGRRGVVMCLRAEGFGEIHHCAHQRNGCNHPITGSLSRVFNA